MHTRDSLRETAFTCSLRNALVHFSSYGHLPVFLTLLTAVNTALAAQAGRNSHCPRPPGTITKERSRL